MLQALELADVERLLDDAQAELLHWEAKGVEIKPGTVRKQICGFANSHDGGYLILGTSAVQGKWTFDGAEFPGNDPLTWISDVARGLRAPRTRRLDPAGRRPASTGLPFACQRAGPIAASCASWLALRPMRGGAPRPEKS